MVWKGIVRAFKAVWKYSLAIALLYVLAIILALALHFNINGRPNLLAVIFNNSFNLLLYALPAITVLSFAYIGFVEQKKAKSLLGAVKTAIYAAIIALLPFLGVAYLMIGSAGCSAAGQCMNVGLWMLIFAVFYALAALIISAIGAFAASKLIPQKKKR